MSDEDESGLWDPSRPFVDFSDAEFDTLIALVEREKLARSFVAIAVRSSLKSDSHVELVQAVDRAQVGIFIFDALEIELSPPMAARHFDGGEDSAALIRFRQSLQTWATRTSGDPAAVQSRIRRIAGHSINWKQRGAEATALEKEATDLEKWADRESRKKSPSEIIIERRRAFALQLKNEAKQMRKLLDRRGWHSGRSHLAERDFVYDLILIARALRPELEVHARPRTVWDDEEWDETAGLPGEGFPEFVEAIRAHLHDRPHVPEGWRRATENAIKHWNKKQKPEL